MSTTRRRRPALIALVTAATCGCLALAWWQFSRFESSAGDFQNLGYALQWPVFAAFCVYAYRTFVRYEEAPPEHDIAGVLREIPEGLLPPRPAARTDAPDPVLSAYNDHLRALAAERSDAREDRNPA